MQEENNTPASLNIDENINVVQTDIDNKIGQDKCPKCGSSDIELNISNGKLRCNFCRFEFEPERVAGLEDNVFNLNGTTVGSGATTIDEEASDVITLKCESCGAEVVVDTTSSTQARCHWCRNILSINKQIPNGSVPDVVLPFKITKDEAQRSIETFVRKRKFFAHPTFVKEFNTNNIMGVYFPYMLVDINAHAKLVGQGEHQTGSYTVKHGDTSKTYYNADLYNVEREFDIAIDDLQIESSKDRLNNSDKKKTNNIINAIMPFDTENCVKYNSNYLRGFTSEKRDIDIEGLKPIVMEQAKDISRFTANESLKQYNRGVRWDNETLETKGTQWEAAYLPVWLYSYQQVSGNKKLLHYVAVNARTKETQGSVPIHMPKLLFVSLLVEILGIILFILINSDEEITYILFFLGFIYYVIMYARYRNSGARHKHEKETTKQVDNLVKKDEFVKHETGLENHRMHGANNNRVNGSTNSKSIVDIVKNTLE